MKKLNKGIFLLVLLAIFLTGCKAELSEEKESFEAKGITYTIQLLENWTVDATYQTRYGQNASFGASDKKSNSSMFISVNRRSEGDDLSDFGELKREQLAETYGYESADELYMKTFEWEGHEAYKFTAFTTFENRDTWAHIYYLITEEAVIQVVYYSADDGNYEQRSEIIEDSVQSLKQGHVDKSWEPEEDEDSTEDSARLNTPSYTFDIKGFQKLEEKEEQLLVIRYTVKNKTEDLVTAEVFGESLNVKQGDVNLEAVPFPESEKETEAGRLADKKDRQIEAKMTGETVAVYRLDNTKELIHIVVKGQETAEQITLDLSLLK